MALGCPAPCFSRAPAISRGSPVPRSTLLPPVAPPFSLSLKFSARIELLRDGCHGVHQRSRPAHVLHGAWLCYSPPISLRLSLLADRAPSLQPSFFFYSASRLLPLPGRGFPCSVPCRPAPSSWRRSASPLHQPCPARFPLSAESRRHVASPCTRHFLCSSVSPTPANFSGARCGCQIPWPCALCRSSFSPTAPAAAPGLAPSPRFPAPWLDSAQFASYSPLRHARSVPLFLRVLPRNSLFSSPPSHCHARETARSRHRVRNARAGHGETLRVLVSESARPQPRFALCVAVRQVKPQVAASLFQFVVPHVHL
jgi:hypothetical protein